MMDNDGKHIATALERVSCKKHGAPKGVPCWTLPKNSGDGFGRYAAICGARIRRAGYIGQVSPASMRRTPSRPANERGPIARAKQAFNKLSPGAKHVKPARGREYASSK